MNIISSNRIGRKGRLKGFIFREYPWHAPHDDG